MMTGLQNALMTVFLVYGGASHAQSLWDRLFFDHFDGMEMGKGMGGDVEIQWSETPKAHVLTVTPKASKDVPLDIDIANGFVKVSGKVVKREVVERGGSKSHSSYLSRFSNSFAVPEGADESKAKIEQAGPSVKITFPKIVGYRPQTRPKRPLKTKKSKRRGLRNLDIPGDRI
ncbi:MAG: hypothetical protein OXB88_06860 [Bacteriovoracales bacterium]|nr:hypothetical protein [Bacteriovoracales bacterium]